MNITKWLYTLILPVAFVACNDDNSITPFDVAGQLDTDKALINTYLENHSYDSDTNTFVDLQEGQASLLSQLSDEVQPNTLKKIEVTIDDLVFPLYVYTIKEGTNPSDNKTPGRLDLVDVEYTLTLLDSDEVVEERSVAHNWFTLPNTIVGWAEAMPYLKPGTVTRASGTDLVEYSGEGEAFIIIPSGLAYENTSRTGIPENSILVYNVKLRDVALTDHDLDGIPTRDELGEDTSNLLDTDGDGVPNYLDIDDDGDEAFTTDEVESNVTLRDSSGNILEYTLTLTDANASGTPDYLESSVK